MSVVEEEETKISDDLVVVTIVWESEIGREVEILPQRLSATMKISELRAHLNIGPEYQILASGVAL